MIKVHQLCSGTIKFESGNSTILDYSKAEFIYNKFNNKKIAIFYKFTQEFKALKEIYPKLERTNNILETGLSNINTVLHAPILALNAG